MQEIYGIISALLLAFGIFGLWNYIMGRIVLNERDPKKNLKMNLILLSFFGSIFLGGYIFFIFLWELLWRKILGIIMFLVGGFLLTKFHDISDYQEEKMTLLAIFLGLILLFTGLFWIMF